MNDEDKIQHLLVSPVKTQSGEITTEMLRQVAEHAERTLEYVNKYGKLPPLTQMEEK